MQQALHPWIERRPGLDESATTLARILPPRFSREIDPQQQLVPDLPDQLRQPDDIALRAGGFSGKIANLENIGKTTEELHEAYPENPVILRLRIDEQ